MSAHKAEKARISASPARMQRLGFEQIATANSESLERLSASQFFIDARKNSFIDSGSLEEGMPFLGSYKPETVFEHMNGE